MRKDLQANLARKDSKGIDTDHLVKLICQERELGEAAHGEETLEDECAAGVGRRREVGPYDRDGLALGDGKGVQSL